jgi:lipoprotein-releasing system ATP-binding protein
MTAPLIEARNVTRVLPGIVPVALVHDINLSIATHEFVAVTGESGSGKSSLLYLLGLLDLPTEGDVLIRGISTSHMSEEERARVRLVELGFVFQFHFLLVEFTLLDNIAMPMRALGTRSASEIRDRAEDLLDSMGLADHRHKRPDQISGGQRQRVAVARALANDPAVILADEPTAWNLRAAWTVTCSSWTGGLSPITRRRSACRPGEPGRDRWAAVRLKSEDLDMTLHRMRVVKITLLALAAGAAGIYGWYRADLAAAEARISSDRAVARTAIGPIEYGQTGSGPPVLVVHGAGGGFDQGLLLGRTFLDYARRIVAPSRFGYLGTLLPSDAGVGAQAAAHAALLDALGIESAPVVGVSAGAYSAIELARAAPRKVSALVLVVPAFGVEEAPETLIDPPNPFVMSMIETGADFAFWALGKFARARLVRFVGVDPVFESAAAPEIRAEVSAVLDLILPVGRRMPGANNDAAIVAALKPYPLAELPMPVLLLCARDDLLVGCGAAERAAAKAPNVKFIAYATGGHLLIGRRAEVRAEIERFLQAVRQ